MNLLSIRIITADVDTLIEFYEQVIGAAAVRYTPVFAEIKTPVATLAIAGTETLQLFGGDAVAEAGQNRSAIIEFRVENVDQEFERLSGYLQDKLVQPPTTMPWGNRSMQFRDPDGGLVNYFTPVTSDAIAKFKELG